MLRFHTRPVAFFVGIASLIVYFGSAAFAQTSTITYQGRLADSGTPANGPYDLQFKLYDALTSGNLQGSPNTVTKTGVSVTNGIFTVQLDFGAAAFPGADRFLDIGVKHPADSSYTELLPRQQLSSAPYAIKALTATNNVLKAGDTMSGDLNLGTHNLTNAGSITATSLSGTLNPTNLSSGTAGISVTGSAAGFTGNLGGDVTGTQGNTTIARLRGANLDSTSPTDGQVLKYDAASAKWTPSSSNALVWQVVSGTSQQAQPNNGYIADNTSQVTITLPASPNIGDIVRVAGAGLGGWRVVPNSGQLVTGIPVAAGASWTARDSNRDWTAAASSADGRKLVAVVKNGQIYTSTDSGVSWTRQETNRFWISVASSADGAKLVAAALGGRIYTSTNSGASWTPRESTRQWFATASSADGSNLVAAVANGQIYTSTDSGVNWIPRESVRFWDSVASSLDGSKLVAATLNGQIYTSTDSGVTWTPRESTRAWSSVASSADGNLVVAVVNGGQIYTSIDSGANWTPRDSDRVWISVASSADGSRLIAVEQGGQIYTSTDSGVSWTPRESNRNWSSVASSAGGNKLVALDMGGKIYTSSVNAVGGGPSAVIELQYIGNGQFLVLSHEGTLTGN